MKYNSHFDFVELPFIELKIFLQALINVYDTMRKWLKPKAFLRIVIYLAVSPHKVVL